MRNKTKKVAFTLLPETVDLLNRISADCDMTKVLVIQRGIELLAEKKGVEK